jgi:hypothetical protein
MIASVVGSALHAGAAAATLISAPLAPQAVLSHYHTALAALREPSTFTVEYTLEQTGARALDQTHRIFRRGNDERDEIIAVNGTRATAPAIRIFRGTPYHYRVARLAPAAAAYTFTYLGANRSGRHLEYVFKLTPKGSSGDFTLTRVSIDGLSFLPTMIAFRTSGNAGKGTVSFGKVGPYWVVTGASASARVQRGTTNERLAFANWRFPASLPPSTFAVARPLPLTLTAPG